ncbi:protein unc-93 homolog A-like [Mizuhopecten yessoensis]|uniref:protein unc-93 homolog A-like n=1 Tax=Mizuhopecten yessoensis TaxID=6573 RepID=UPI000B45F1CE|nr:protein unc-93 homolog A-like [Mizuhopecten yessoensis]
MPSHTASASNSDGSLHGFINIEEKTCVPMKTVSSPTLPKGQYSHINGANASLTNTAENEKDASKISGNLLASVLLKQDENTNISMTSKEIEDCVANKQEAVDNATTLERPDDTTIYTICGTWIGLGIAGMIVLAFLTSVNADGDNSKKRKRGSLCSSFLAAAKHFWNSRLQKILIPVTLYYGILNGFVVADFTRSIVGCTVGIQAVGEVMLCHGIFNTISAALIGRLVKNFGHLPFFTFTIYGHLFADNKDAAFGSYFMLEATGYITAMAYSALVSTDIKLYILLILLVFSVISYYTVEYIDRKNNTHKDADREKV